MLSPQASLGECMRILQICMKEKDPPKTLSFHAYMRKCGRESHVSLGNYLVSMLIDIRRVYDAQHVFQKLDSPDEWSWNALIHGYVHSGMHQDALRLYRNMVFNGKLHPSGHSFALLLKSCISLKDIETGLNIHGEITRTGSSLERNVFVGSRLVDMYAKCGMLDKARQVFTKIQSRDVVLWTSLLTGYVEHGYVHEAMNCFEQMMKEGISPDSITFVCTLKACGSIGSLERGQELHAEIAQQGLVAKNLVVGNALVDMYAKCGSICKAKEVFNNLQERNVVSWNVLLSAYVDYGHNAEAVECFDHMQAEGISPDSVSIILSLKACANMGDFEKGSEIHAEIERSGLLDKDVFISSALVDMYAKCDSLAMARKVFDKIRTRDTVVWTALIAGYSEHGHGEEALECLDQMQFDGFPPNAITIVCSLKACGCIGAIDKGEELHAEIERQGLLEKDLVLANALVDMYAKCGLLVKAQQVFDRIQNRDVISWNSLIMGYAQLGESKKVFQNFDKMLGEGMNPDPITYLVVLTACLRTGLLHKGGTYFEAMSVDHGIIPTLEHHACLADLLGRVGHIDMAIYMMKKMPFSPNLVMWRTMLDTCRTLGNQHTGLQAFANAMSLDKEDATLYSFMTEILANSTFCINR